MSNPDSVPACIKSLSSTTFVAEVTSPALAVLVPLLIRALNDRSMEVQRRTVVVIDNLVKLVRDPNVAARYLSPLVEGVSKIAKRAAFPEVSSRDPFWDNYYIDMLRTRSVHSVKPHLVLWRNRVLHRLDLLLPSVILLVRPTKCIPPW